MIRLSDNEVCEWLTKWCKETNAPESQVFFKTDIKKRIVYIFTSHPGILIGKAGVYAKKYEDLLKEIVNEHNRLVEKINSEGKYNVKLEKMKYYSYKFVEVTRADYWVNYDPMGEGF